LFCNTKQNKKAKIDHIFMSNSISFEISGLREVQEKIKSLPDQLGKKVIYQALRKGGAVLRKEAQANLAGHVKTGTLRKGFKIARSRIHESATEFGVYLTLKKGGGRSDSKDPFYGRWVEHGHYAGKKTGEVERRARQSGRQRGQAYRVNRRAHFVPGIKFMGRAFEAKASEAAQTAAAAADEGAQKVINELRI
jgi:hypothetical protein